MDSIDNVMLRLHLTLTETSAGSDKLARSQVLIYVRITRNERASNDSTNSGIDVDLANMIGRYNGFGVEVKRAQNGTEMVRIKYCTYNLLAMLRLPLSPQVSAGVAELLAGRKTRLYKDVKRVHFW